MKNAYVSFIVLNNAGLNSESLSELDSYLSQTTHLHEILLFGDEVLSKVNLEILELKGALSLVSSIEDLLNDNARTTLLARAAGDFIIESYLPVNLINKKIIANLLDPTDRGVELVELLKNKSSFKTRIILRLINILQDKKNPIHEIALRVYSRQSLGMLLKGINKSRHLEAVIAEIPLPREISYLTFSTNSSVLKSRYYLSLLFNGTRFGVIVPISLSIVSGLVAIFSGMYALTFYLIDSETPEGWTTLMLIVSFGQSAILGMLGLIWVRINTLTSSIYGNNELPTVVKVHPPKIS